MHKELIEYAELLKRHSFTVYRLHDENRASWLIFGKDNKVGYCDYREYEGFHFSTKHKPNRKCGTGYRIHGGVSNPTVQHAYDCFVFAANWAFKSDFKHIKKYKDIEEYIEKNKWAKYVKM